VSGVFVFKNIYGTHHHGVNGVFVFKNIYGTHDHGVNGVFVFENIRVPTIAEWGVLVKAKMGDKHV
jgi:hypothetical protein